MIQVDRELLLKDLCSRLPYGVKIELTWWVMDEGTCINTTLEPDHIEQLLNDEYGDTEIKSYLRQMSSMTKEEYEELRKIDKYYGIAPLSEINDWEPGYKSIDWLNSHHFDYRGLIPKNLAIEVTKENNPYKLD